MKSKSALERRLNKINQESQLLRDDIKTISRALRKQGDFRELPGLKSTPTLRPSGGAGAPQEQKRKGAAGPSQKTRAGKASRVKKTGARTRASRRGSSKRFANYFSAGSIVAATPLRQEKSVQRNKAIFMVVFVVLVSFVVLRLVL